MIPNPENVFEQLQNDVAAKLVATAPFNSIKFPDGSDFKVLTEDEGDIQFEFDQMIALLGLAITVHAPTGEIDPAFTDMIGPILSKVSFDVWISEAPTFNRSENGTKVRLTKAMTIIMGTLQGFQPASVGSPVYCRGFDKARERIYDSSSDKTGRLIISRIVHFVCPAVVAEITSE